MASETDGTVLTLFDARRYPSNAHDAVMVQIIEAINRERRIQGSDVDAYLRVAPSTVGESEDGVFAVQAMQQDAMMKISNMALRLKINDLGMDLTRLRSDAAKNSSRGFIECWQKTIADYTDLKASDQKWNVCEGADMTAPFDGGCTLVARRDIAAGDELSVCYGVHFWLKECKHLLTDRNALGVWCVLASYVKRDTALQEDDGEFRSFCAFAAMCERLIQNHTPARQFNFSVPAIGQDAFLSIELLDQYDAMFGSVEKTPPVSLGDKIGSTTPISIPCSIQ